mmetsp:Transcript_125468/g.366486  ORF Transcript_125468/g.366486 Transcript_125468/m.366486 type:complete len:286 (+) Transcript_125468:285-1142(+)
MLLESHLLDPRDGFPAPIAVLCSPAWARITPAVLVFVLDQALLHLLEGRLPGEVLVPLWVLVNALRDDPQHALVAGHAGLGGVAGALHVDVPEHGDCRAVAGRGAELRGVGVVLLAEEGLDLIVGGVRCEALVPLVVTGHVLPGPEDVAVAGLAGNCRVAVLVVILLVLLALLLPVLQRILPLRGREAAGRGADALLVEVVLDHLEASILREPGVPLGVVRQVLLHRVDHMVVALLPCTRRVALLGVEGLVPVVLPDDVAARKRAAREASVAALLVEEGLNLLEV